MRLIRWILRKVWTRSRLRMWYWRKRGFPKPKRMAGMIAHYDPWFRLDMWIAMRNQPKPDLTDFLRPKRDEMYPYRHSAPLPRRIDKGDA